MATARRTDSGHIQIRSQLPELTQAAPEHDVIMVTDESDIFGEYLLYRTWEPRPVVGTQGLIASAALRVPARSTLVSRPRAW